MSQYKQNPFECTIQQIVNASYDNLVKAQLKKVTNEAEQIGVNKAFSIGKIQIENVLLLLHKGYPQESYLGKLYDKYGNPENMPDFVDLTAEEKLTMKLNS